MQFSSDFFDVYVASKAGNEINEVVTLRRSCFTWQDAFAVDLETGCFVLCDGHGGRVCSRYIADRFTDEFKSKHKKATAATMRLTLQLDLLQEIESKFFSKVRAPESLPERLQRMFVDLDRQYIEENAAQHPYAGSCCLVCVIEGGKVVCANAGDCRAIVGSVRRKIVRSHQISTDHVASNKDERALVLSRSRDPSAPPYPPPP
jgi:serine/threonine protein phosphatase PrpC